MYFTIDTDNEVVVHETAPAAQDGTILFATEKGFAKAAAEWPLGRLAETWNGFAGVAGVFGDLKPVKKFMDRQTGIKRIWKAIQLLAEDVMRANREAEVRKAAQAAPAPPAAKKAPKPASKPEATEPASADTKPAAREGTRKAQVIEMLKREGGVSLDEIIALTGWQKHTIRAFVSTLPKKTGIVITSTRRESDKARVYAAQ